MVVEVQRVTRHSSPQSFDSSLSAPIGIVAEELIEFAGKIREIAPGGDAERHTRDGYAPRKDEKARQFCNQSCAELFSHGAWRKSSLPGFDRLTPARLSENMLQESYAGEINRVR
jgi:hypothetical protein